MKPKLLCHSSQEIKPNETKRISQNVDCNIKRKDKLMENLKPSLRQCSVKSVYSFILRCVFW